MDYTEEIRCPKCNSNQFTSNQKGFSAGKAIGGAFLTGGVGLLAGFIGSKKVIITCLKCGKNFKAGEGKIVRVPISISYSSKTNSEEKPKSIVGEVNRPLSGVEEINNATIVWSEEQLLMRNKKELSPEEIEIRDNQKLEQEKKHTERRLLREQRQIEAKKDRRIIRVVLSVVVFFIAVFTLVRISSEIGEVYFLGVLLVLGVAGLVLKAIWELTK